MKDRLVPGDLRFPANDEAAEIAQPGEGPFHFPTALIPAQLATILPWRSHAVLPMGTNQINAASRQSLPQGIRVPGFVIDHTRRPLTGTTRIMARNGHGVQRRLQPLHFGGGRRFQEVSQRNTLAVDHHHPLRALAAFGLADFGPPCFAGAKLPSAKGSAPSSWPRASSCAKRGRQAFTHSPCSSPPRKRRQQVLGEGNRSGRSFHRAPVRKIQRIPSKQGRFGFGFGPPRGGACGSGNNGAIFVHGWSVSSNVCLAIETTPFDGHKSTSLLMGQDPRRIVMKPLLDVTTPPWMRRMSPEPEPSLRPMESVRSEIPI
jgi:hypothetical protein